MQTRDQLQKEILEDLDAVERHMTETKFVFGEQFPGFWRKASEALTHADRLRKNVSRLAGLSPDQHLGSVGTE